MPNIIHERPATRPTILPFAKQRREPRSRIVSAEPATLALDEASIRARLEARLRRLDPEQLQIVEIVIAAISRGALPPHVGKGA